MCLMLMSILAVAANANAAAAAAAAAAAVTVQESHGMTFLISVSHYAPSLSAQLGITLAPQLVVGFARVE